MEEDRVLLGYGIWQIPLTRGLLSNVVEAAKMGFSIETYDNVG